MVISRIFDSNFIPNSVTAACVCFVVEIYVISTDYIHTTGNNIIDNFKAGHTCSQNFTASLPLSHIWSSVVYYSFGGRLYKTISCRLTTCKNGG